jgi:putative membrane protein
MTARVATSVPPHEPIDASEPATIPADRSDGAATMLDHADVTREPVGRTEPSAQPLGRTRLSGTWTVVAAGLILLVLLLVFILLNLQRVEVNLFGAHTQLPLAVALLLAVVVGAALVFAIGAARILQVRLRARRSGSSTPS